MNLQKKFAYILQFINNIINQIGDNRKEQTQYYFLGRRYYPTDCISLSYIIKA